MIMTDEKRPLQFVRDLRGMSQQDLAVAAGMSTYTISRIERGFPTTRKTLVRLARALECNPDMLRVNVKTKKEN